MTLEEAQPSTYDFWILIRPRVLWFLLISAVVSGGVLAFSLTWPDNYTATVRFASPRNADTLNWIVAGDNLIEKMDQRFGLRAHYGVSTQRELRRSWERKVTAKKSKDNFVDISVIDSDPQFASSLANGIALQAQQEVLNRRLSEAARNLAQQAALLRKAQANSSSTDKAVQAPEVVRNLEAISGFERFSVESLAKMQAETAFNGMSVLSTQSPSQAGLISPNQELVRLQAQLLSALRDAGGKVQSHTTEQMQAISLLQEHVYWRSLAEILQRQVDNLREQALSDLPFEAALVPDSRSGPNRVSVTVLAFLLTFFVCVMALLALTGWRKLKLGYAARTQGTRQ